MAIKPRGMTDEVLYALVAANNQHMLDNISTAAHLDRTVSAQTLDYKAPAVTRLSVTHAAATNATTQLSLCNAIRIVLDKHFVDPIAHNTAVSAVITVATATDATTANALANDLKAKYNIHLSAANVHYTNDGTNTIAAADATDATTLQTLVNELRTDVNAHIASAPVGLYIDVVAP